MKLGLALSGGGFRASFFHIGVLARMAEIGKLREVEVISTVSGGSIIGAMYYVKLKKLLDGNASPDNRKLVRIVKEIETEFLEGVQKNVRMRTFVNPIKNLRMSFANYSRSDRLAELYDRYFYRPILAPGSDSMIKMRDLKIVPGGNKKHPLDFNAELAPGGCKLPIILINSTSLNSGHNWRFEASRMGEPEHRSPDLMVIDKNARFSRPATYDDMPEGARDIKLGHAVAASACVPILFNPLAISTLYQDARIQLVDGGVHDNQGIEALLDKNCDEIVISDASGQMEDEMEPSAHIPHVAIRSNGILTDRLREEELLDALHNSSVRTTLLHLRKGLPPKTIPYINQKSPDTPAQNSSLKFGVHPDIQDALSKIRTDLDSFSDIEANALMADGYLMSCHSFESNQALTDGTWRFLHLRNDLGSNSNQWLMKILRAARYQFGKAFILRPVVSSILAIAIILIIGGIVWLLFGDWIRAFLNRPLEITTNKELFIYIGGAVLLAVGPILLSRWNKLYNLFKFIRKPASFIGRLLFRAVPPALGSVFVWIHLAFFDRIFLGAGSREHFVKKS